MSVNPASSAQSNAAAQQMLTSASSDVMGKDDFLQLLVTQLGNQDPLNPMDGKDFAAQLAQFSSVEQLMNIGDVLAGNGEMNGVLAQSINSGVAAGLIGKTIEAEGAQFSWNGESEVPLGVDLESAAQSIKITVRDQSGNVIRTIESGAASAGATTVAWDGKTDTGHNAPKGTYHFEVDARMADESVAATPYIAGRVDRVTFGQDGIRLWVGGSAVSMGAVRSVNE